MKSLFTTGFTLVELMVTIATMATVLAFAVPAYKSTVRSAILTSEMNEFVASLNFARSEAVNRAMRVAVRRVDPNWEKGWQIFTDNNSNGIKDGTDQLLRVHGPLTANYTLRGNNNFTRFIAFKPSGESNNPGAFVLCDNSDGTLTPAKGTSRLIIISILGRITLGTDSNGNGIPEKIDGDGNATDINSCASP